MQREPSSCGNSSAPCSPSCWPDLRDLRGGEPALRHGVVRSLQFGQSVGRGLDAAVRADHRGGDPGRDRRRHGDLVRPAPLAPRSAAARGRCAYREAQLAELRSQALRRAASPAAGAAARAVFTCPPGETSRARRCRSGPARTRFSSRIARIRYTDHVPAVKICGLSTRETLDAALEAGADMVGFVFFPPSPRHLALETARDLGPQVKQRA